MLAEFGHKHPCVTEGKPILVEETEAEPGDIIEFYLIPDRELTHRDAIDIAYKALEIKKDYPDAVIHYLRIDSEQVTVQFSTSPMGGAKYTWWHIIIYVLLLLLVIYGITWSVKEIANVLRGVPPTGDFSISAVGCDDSKCTAPYAISVPFDFNGKSYDHTPVTITDLLQGTYTIAWGAKEGYQTPSPIKVTVVAGEKRDKTAHYFADGVTPPTTGWFVVDTRPVKGMVYIRAEEIGVAPIEKEVDVGRYVVSFGDVEGYEAPVAETWDIAPLDVIAITATYKRVGLPTWAWAVIGVTGAVAVAAAIASVVTKLVRRE